MPAHFSYRFFRAQNGFKLFALVSLESLDSSRSPSPYQPENLTSNKLQSWQDHDVRNLITSWADHKHMFGGKQRKKEIFDKIATDTGNLGRNLKQNGKTFSHREIPTKISGIFF